MFPQSYAECPHFNECSGCELKFSEAIPLIEEAKSYFANHGICDVQVVQGSPHGYRLRAKLAVRGSVDNPIIGLFEKGSHNAVSIPQCKVHHKSINRLVEKIKDEMAGLKLEPYHESGKGLLRYIQCVVQQSSGRIQLVLVVNAKSPSPILPLVEVLWKNYPDLLHSIWVNCNTYLDNRIFSSHWEHILGEKYLWEKILDKEICFSAASFGQANLTLFEKMLLDIKKILPKHSKAIELYAGIGVISLCLLDNFDSIDLVEINPQSEEVFLESCEKLSEFDKKKLNYKVCPSEKALDLIEGKSIAIVDPPRKGLDRTLIDALTKSSLNTLIYISCGFASFKRDCDALLGLGWKLELTKIYLFFPGSNHIETLAIFKK